MQRLVCVWINERSLVRVFLLLNTVEPILLSLTISWDR